MRRALLATITAIALITPAVAQAPPATGSRVHNGQPQQPGWHSEHALDCGIYIDPNATAFYFIHTNETGALIFAVNAPAVMQDALPACASGNWIGWNVVDGSTGAFNVLEAFSYK